MGQSDRAAQTLLSLHYSHVSPICLALSTLHLPVEEKESPSLMEPHL